MLFLQRLLSASDLWLIGRTELVCCLMFGGSAIVEEVDSHSEENRNHKKIYCVYLTDENKKRGMVCIGE